MLKKSGVNKIKRSDPMPAHRMIFLFSFILAIVFIVSVFAEQKQYFTAQGADDTEAPAISDIKVDNLTASTSQISWKTNEKADSIINYGLDKNYGVVRDPLLDNSHTLGLSNLLPNSTYYFRITSSDKSGNQGISNDFIFTTGSIGEETTAVSNQTKKPGAGTKDTEGKGSGQGETEVAGSGLGEGTQNAEGQGMSSGQTGAEGQGMGAGQLNQEGNGNCTTQNVVNTIKNTKDITTLQTISDTIETTAASLSSAPFAIESVPEIIEVGSDHVTIGWKTPIDSNSIIALSTASNYNPNSTDPYAWKEGEPNVYTKIHEVTINGLQPATIYHFQAQSKSKIGPIAKSDDRTFTTKSIKPEIYNITIDKLEDEAATLVWYTNIPCNDMVDYTNLENNETKSEGNPNYVTRHSIRLTNLKFDTTYAAIIRVENEYGEKNSSAPLTFTTIKDIIPPVISKVTTESTIYPGADSKIQTIISWDTDEPANCQFFYHQGLFSKGESSSLTAENSYTTKHIQVAVAFQQGTVYKFWLTCKDKTGNERKSDDFTLLTPTKEQSIIDIIIANFQSTFGWMKKLNGGGG